ncbi:MAG: ATP-binding protein [Clostridiales bacterium]|nr:ATP-binding protein [Clostridiales bacterium]
MNQWTLHVEEFGKIKEADITMAPLTMFIGDNNSGKSYLMTLIYGLLHLSLSQYKYDENSMAFQSCWEVIEKIFEKAKNADELEYTFSDSDINCTQDFLNEILEKNLSRFILSLFNREVSIKKLRIEFPKNMDFHLTAGYIGTAEEKIGLNVETSKAAYSNPYLIISDKTHIGSFKGINEKWLWIRFVLENFLKISPDTCEEPVVYLPTTRTGFLLTYKTLVGNALEDKFTVQPVSKNLLTRPSGDFLRSLSTMRADTGRNKYENCIDFTEKYILSGKIEVSQLPSHDVLYHPAGSEEPIPMFVSSGVVTEVTPLLLFLRYVDFGTLMIEEPEICLHPELQWRMMQLLIRIQNEGVPVFLTTHSDFMLQHVNNMIKANEMQQKEVFLENNGYAEEDLLNRENTAVYQFDADARSGQSTVTKLKCGDYGYELPTFYETLKRMNRQIDDIEGLEESCLPHR